MSTDFQKHRKVVHAHRNGILGILCRVIGMCEHTESLACVSTHQGHLGRALTAHARSQHMHSSRQGRSPARERAEESTCVRARDSCNELQRAATSCNELSADSCNQTQKSNNDTEERQQRDKREATTQKDWRLREWEVRVWRA